MEMVKHVEDARRKLLERLLIDEEEALERLVRLSEQVLRIDKKTGNTVVIAPRSKLTDREVIYIVLLGRYFANKLGLVDKDSMPLSEISEHSGVDEKAASARLSELKRERAVESLGRGEHRIAYANVETVLGEINDRLGR